MQPIDPSALPTSTQPLSTHWAALEQSRHNARISVRFAFKVFLLMLGLGALMVPAECATLRTNDYGLKATDDTQTVGEIGALIFGILAVLIVIVQIRALIEASRVYRQSSWLRLAVKCIDIPDERESQNKYLSTVGNEIRNEVIFPALGWLVLSVLALVYVRTILFPIAPTPP